MPRFVMAQIKTSPAAVQHNQQRIAEIVREQMTADLVVFPEMTLSGYPLGDLVHRPDLLDACGVAAKALAEQFSSGPAILLGTPWRGEGIAAHVDRVQNADAPPIYNAVLLLRDGEVIWLSSKYHLPNEGIFDEKRNFVPATTIASPIEIAGVRLGVMICHDAWFDDVAETFTESGAEAFVVLNASPYECDGKIDQRFQALLSRVVENKCPLMTVNLVGAQDGVVFDGASLVFNADSRLVYQAPSFAEDIRTLEVVRTDRGIEFFVPGFVAQDPPQVEADMYSAILLSLKDFVEKNSFTSVVLGLSGGVDSALVATLAVDALGSENVHCVMMPSPYTRTQSLQEAEQLAKNLHVTYSVIPIAPMMQTFDHEIGTALGGPVEGVVAENLQARIRGDILMALSNHFGALLLSTGNKSEIAVGYCTLYGDMCGGFNPVADVYKTQLYALCQWRNSNGDFPIGKAVIPEGILTRPPSAELAPDQQDSDSLPPYAELDPLLHGLIEEGYGIEEMVAKGFARETVVRVLKLLDAAQHKRYQAPLGTKLTSCALKTQWRYPLTNGFCQDIS